MYIKNKGLFFARMSGSKNFFKPDLGGFANTRSNFSKFCGFLFWKSPAMTRRR